MSRRTLLLYGSLLLSLCGNAQAEKPNGNRLAYLDEPCNPYYVHRDFPKLTTPMWVGEEGVEAVVILGIDDMRGHEKWEAYLRPILNRLKQIDGRAPVSIMTCTIDTKHPHLQQWLEEGLSLEVHTVDHPCPLLGGIKAKGVKEQGLGVGGQGLEKAKGDNAATLNSQLSTLNFSKDTYDRCVDLLNDVPNNKPVCFRMPCCDSLNTLSPRFFTEIFAKTTPIQNPPSPPGGEGPGVRGKGGNFLQADSSVFNVFTSDDPVLPRELVLEEARGEGRGADKATNRNALAPSPLRGEGRGEGPQADEPATKPPLTLTLSPKGRGDKAEAQPAGPRLRERFRKYIPADRFFANTIENYPYPYVIDRLCWEFPCVAPSDWSAQHLHKPNNPQTVEDWKAALDCTVIKQGVFCLVFHPHNWIKPEQINELIDHAVTKHGKKVKFLTFKEAVERLNKNVLGGQSLRNANGIDAGVRLHDFNNDRFLDVLGPTPDPNIVTARFDHRSWSPKEHRWDEGKLADAATVFEFPLDIRAFGHWWIEAQLRSRPQPLKFLATHDLDSDGQPELFTQNKNVTEIFQAKFALGLRVNPSWEQLPFQLPIPPVKVVDATGQVGFRFIDVNADGHDDIVFSNHERYGIWLWESMEKGWSRELLSGQRGSKPANEELPPIVRADGSNNGFWVHSRNLVWMNEDTAKSKDLVERRSFDELLAKGQGLRGKGDGKDKNASAPSPPRGEGRGEGQRADGPIPKSPLTLTLSPEGRGNKADGEKTQPSADPDGPKSPEESLKLMQVKPGYRVELVAAEPLVRDPVAFDWGPDGKLWVAEMADYPLGVRGGEEADNADATLKANGGRQPPGASEAAQRDRSAKSTSGLTPTVRLLEQAGHKRGGGRVRILEDTDGDGKYDKSTVFLDKLNFPNGVMPWRDGVLISAAPDVLFARDTNGDNKADEVKVLLTGFGEGNQQHRVNGFSWGLDNMVHCANGDSGGTITVVASLRDANSKPKSNGDAKSESRSDSATRKTIDIRGRDFRWNPDTGEIDPTSGQTQFGRNRDDFGNWFGNNNANPMYHFVLDDYYIRRNPHVAPPDPKKQVSITPGPSPVFPISRTLARFNDFAMANRFTSANSAMVYRDTLLFEGSGVRGQGSEKTKDKTQNTNDSNSLRTPHSALPTLQHVFISEPVHNLVHHEIMTADGVTFTSRRADDEQQSEFLASRDNWFRPTQIKTGPDGALYIADMYRQVIEHPQYIPPAMQEKLNVRAGHDKGRIYRVVAEPMWIHLQPHWPLNDATDQELAMALFSSNGVIRDLAHRLLFWRNDAQSAKDERASLLSEIATKEPYKEPGRIESGLLIRGMTYSSAFARLHAISLLDALHSLPTATISTCLQDKHHSVRRRALQAVEHFDGELPPPLVNQISGMGRDPDPFVRMQFAYTLGHPKFASLGNELGKLLYRERDDKYLVAAAMSSIHAKNVASVVANYLEASAADQNASRGATSPTLASTLLNLAATLGEDQALLNLIEYVLSGAATTESQPVMLGQVLETLDRRGTSLSQLKGIAPQRLARAEQQLTARIEAARAEISNFKSQISDLNSANSNLKSEILNLKSESAITSLPLLGRVADQRSTDAKLVGELLIPQAPVPVQSAAVTTLARINHMESAAVLLGGWRTFTPTLRTQVLDALLSRAAWTDTLLDSLEAKSIAPSDIDAARRQRLIAHSNEAIRTRAVKLLEVSANADRQKIVAEFASKLKDGNLTGDVTRGAEVFKKRCATCHKLKDIGTSVGADLVALTDKSTAALLTAILDPNKAVEAKFLAYTAVNKQGQTFSGLIAAETGNSITLMAADGKQHTLLRADLDEFISSNKSFMPEGLEKDVSPSELAEVIAFVQSSGPPPKKFDSNQPEAVVADVNGTLRLLATNAEIYGKTLVFEPQFKNLGYWGSVDDRAVWTINVAKPGKHSIRMNYACDNGTAGNEALFEVAGQSVKAKIVGTGSWENYQTAILGELDLPAGQHRLTVRSSETLKNHLMDLREIRLQPE